MLDISEKIDKYTLEILKKIKEITDFLRIDFFIVGASVRDLILHYGYGIKIYRKTNDVDFAVRVKNWDEYNILVKEIEKIGYKEDKGIPHRYICKGMIIDFIPFGDISGEDNIITWPDEDKTKMNVVGFEEAYKNTEEILIQTNPDIYIKSASVECLFMLKIFSWNYRTGGEKLKDAKDIYLIITTYLDAGSHQRLIEHHIDLFEGAVDYELSGARLLGRDIAKVASEKVIGSMLEILKGDKLNILANEMSLYEGISAERDEKTKKCLELLKSLLIGLKDKM